MKKKKRLFCSLSMPFGEYLRKMNMESGGGSAERGGDNVFEINKEHFESSCPIFLGIG